MKVFKLMGMIALIIPAISFSQLADQRKATEGVFDFNYYRDSREFNVFTKNLLATMEGGFQYFSLTNIESEIETSDKTDSTIYYTEQNLRWKLSQSGLFMLSTQAALQSGENNDVARAGVLLNISKLSFLEEFSKAHRFLMGVNFFPIQLDEAKGYNWQMEYFYSIQIARKLFGDRLYLSGFADQNMGPDKTTWVTEHQLGFRVYDNFFLVAEYRINEFLKKNTGWATGVEYVLPFK
jgi:hypothetical protein